MRRFWVIAPYDARYPDEWEQVWKYDLEHGVISIGWPALGDVSALAEDELLRLVRRTYRDYKPAAATLSSGMLHKFYHSVQRGDMLVARRGLKQLAAVGTVKGAGYYDPNKHSEPYDSPDEAFPNHLDVQWANKPRDVVFPEIVFSIQTIYEIPQEKFLSLTESSRRMIPPDSNFPDEVGDDEEFIEGAVCQRTVNAYERDPRARAACIAKHGLRCGVCGMSFERRYGSIGRGFIHVHHKKPLAGRGGEYKLRPTVDLAPVCPNCHAMLHTQEPPLSIEELRTIMQQRNGKKR
ncbi:MAG TPA: HNH endonuclease [Nitrospiria bacterium]|nr:HNH endonuclease [Nitrospiria bacterium]